MSSQSFRALATAAPAAKPEQIKNFQIYRWVSVQSRRARLGSIMVGCIDSRFRPRLRSSEDACHEWDNDQAGQITNSHTFNICDNDGTRNTTLNSLRAWLQHSQFHGWRQVTDPCARFSLFHRTLISQRRSPICRPTRSTWQSADPWFSTPSSRSRTSSTRLSPSDDHAVKVSVAPAP